MQVYYQDQNGWEQPQYYALWRFLNRLFLRSSQHVEEIKEIDLSACSEITKVMMYCFIKTQHKEELFELDNLRDLTTVKPLSEPLRLIIPPTNSNKFFEEFNIIL